MKKTFAILCAALLGACGAPKDPVRVICEVEDGTVTSVVYAPLTPDFDPSDIKTPADDLGEGRYAFPDNGQVQIALVLFNDRIDQQRYVVLLPGEIVTLSGHLNIGTGDPDVRMSGTEIYTELYREMDAIEAQTKRISLLGRRDMAGETLSAEELREYDSLQRWSADYIVDRVRNYPESPTTAYYMMTQMVPDSCFAELYYALPEQVRNGKYKQIYDLIRPTKQGVKTKE